ncbi:DNA-binding protein [Acidovorax sp.]|uniref:DNA-binding protein n=1 Tax=Acidovorax sp. TaxID=1872122 RepID=UPI003D02F862
MTEAQVRRSFDELGVSIADWARERGFSVPLTRMVLAGKRKCLRGQSHQIAVALGLKTGRR